MSIFDYFFYDQGKDEGKSRKAMEEGISAIKGVQDAEYIPVEYQSPEYAGDVTAQMANPYTMGSSAMEGISTDPALRSSQLAQLAALENLRDQGGMTLTDKANLQRIQNDELQKERGQREAILEGARQRGTSGSGMELMALLQSNQAGTNRQSQRDLDIAGMAQDRALQAGNQAANLAGNVRGQDFSQDAQIAAAKDAAAKFNASMMSGTDQFNVGNKLRADLGNRDVRQGVANIGAETQNKQQTMNRVTIPGQRFTSDMAKATAIGNLKGQQSGQYQQAANQGVATQGNLWGSGIQALASLYGGNMKNAASGAAGATTPNRNPQNIYEEDPYLKQEESMTGFWG